MRTFQSEFWGGNRKISGAQWCSWPMQKGHVWGESEEEGAGDLDLKSEGRLARAGENMTQRFVTESLRSWGRRDSTGDAIFYAVKGWERFRKVSAGDQLVRLGLWPSKRTFPPTRHFLIWPITSQLAFTSFLLFYLPLISSNVLRRKSWSL